MDDNGWMFFSDIEDDEYADDPNNFTVCDFNTVANIEPAIIAIYLMPVGTDLQLVSENGKLKFYDKPDGRRGEAGLSVKGLLKLFSTSID